MRYIILLVLLSGCGLAEEISRCASACEKTGKSMVSYSKTNGCICGDECRK